MVTWGDLTLPTLGAGGLVVLFVIAILRGWLVPKATMDARIADKDAIIAAHARTIDEQEKQLDALLPTAEVTRRVLAALPVGDRQ